MNINQVEIKKVKVLAFDLDDTLALSKSAISADMASMISVLLPHFYICVISGGAFSQMETQVISHLPKSNVERLIFFPENGSSLYMWDKTTGNFRAKYRELLSDTQKGAAIKALMQAEIELPQLIGSEVMSQIYGERIDDRGGQITFSALGQEAPIDVKKSWDPDRSKRTEVKAFLDRVLPEDLEVRIGGATSLDIIHKGKDKGYAIHKLLKASAYGLEDFSVDEILFFGDSLSEGGNDYPVKKSGVKVISVSGPGDTLLHLRDIMGGILDTYGEKARS